MNTFYEFDTIQWIKRNAVDYFNSLNEFNKGPILNNMEGLQILTYFKNELEIEKIILNKLNEFFRYDYKDCARFNLIRHLVLIPEICNNAKKIRKHHKDEYDFGYLQKEILCLIVGTQNDDGSWGYFPEKLAPENFNDSSLKNTWNSLTQIQKDDLIGMVNKMNEHYKQRKHYNEIKIKSGKSNVWTAYALLTLNNAKFGQDLVTTKGIRFLLKNKNKDGGWGFNSSERSQISATCIVLRSLISYIDRESISIHDFNSTIHEGLKFLLKKLSKPILQKDIEEVDLGGGSELEPNSIYTFSITTAVIDCLSQCIQKNRSIYENDDISFKDTLDIMERYINILLKKDIEKARIWQSRVTFESFYVLYNEIYVEQIKVKHLNDLPSNLFPFLVAKYSNAKKDLNKYFKPNNLSYWTYLIVFLISCIDIISNVIANKSIVFLPVTIASIGLLMLIAMRKGIKL